MLEGSQGPEETGCGGRKTGRQAWKYLSLRRGHGEGTLSFWASVTVLQKGKKISGQEGKQMSEGKTKQSQALSGLPMATGPLCLEEPLSQERLAGAQSSKGCWPLCLSPINTN